VAPDSSKHSARVDDELAHESRSIVQGAPVEAHRRDDLVVEDELDHAGERPDAGAPPPGMTAEDVERRAALAAATRPVMFPCDRDALLRVAAAENAPEPVIDLLRGLPAGTEWDDLHAVWTAAGGPTEDRF